MNDTQKNQKIQDIEDKYFSKDFKESANPLREPLKQNLQADIGKIEGTMRKISEKQATPSELIRLRSAVTKLLYVIDQQV